jgi:hypothetical protein
MLAVLSPQATTGSLHTCLDFENMLGALHALVSQEFVLIRISNLFNKPERNKPQTVLIRIFTNYIQVVSLVKTFDL